MSEAENLAQAIAALKTAIAAFWDDLVARVAAAADVLASAAPQAEPRSDEEASDDRSDDRVAYCDLKPGDRVLLYDLVPVVVTDVLPGFSCEGPEGWTRVEYRCGDPDAEGEYQLRGTFSGPPGWTCRRVR